MIIYDLFAGTGSATKAFEDAGHTVISVELDAGFKATLHADVTKLRAQDLIEKYGQPDFIWASPPCTCFSVAAIGRHWISGGIKPEPRTDAAKAAEKTVKATLKLIKALNPTSGWLIENPRGMLRKLPVLAKQPRHTVTYCQYGDDRQKPTDIWGVVPNWVPREMCMPGDKCHESAPRGSTGGTQGRANAKERSRVPYELGHEIMIAIGG